MWIFQLFDYINECNQANQDYKQFHRKASSKSPYSKPYKANFKVF